MNRRRRPEPRETRVANHWPYVRQMADRMSEFKRLDVAELSAEYYREAFLHEVSISENDGYDGGPETRQHRQRCTTLWRFAELPHYDEATR